MISLLSCANLQFTFYLVDALCMYHNSQWQCISTLSFPWIKKCQRGRLPHIPSNVSGTNIIN